MRDCNYILWYNYYVLWNKTDKYIQAVANLYEQEEIKEKEEKQKENKNRRIKWKLRKKKKTN